jgi:hypothetical protein
MKKSTFYSIIVVIAVFAFIFGMKKLAQHKSMVLELAKELKTQGLNYDRANVVKSTNMIEEITMQGKDLLVKITMYGNGLFMQNVVNNLEKDKKNNAKIEPQPIYVAGQFIVVVYQEPVKGLVKSLLIAKFKDVSEY